MEKIMGRLGFLLVMSCAILLGSTPALYAQEDGGVLNAISFKGIPSGQAIAVIPLDNSDENLRLQREFERALTARGFAVAQDAPLVLTFEVKDTLGTWSTGQRSVLEFHARGGREGGEDAKVRLNLFDSNQGGVLNEGQGGTRSSSGQYRLDATLDARANGERLWQGWAIAPLRRSDRFSLTKAMVPVVVGEIGHTVKSQPFPVH